MIIDGKRKNDEKNIRRNSSSRIDGRMLFAAE
jgi:hypothetical protein